MYKEPPQFYTYNESLTTSIVVPHVKTISLDTTSDSVELESLPYVNRYFSEPAVVVPDPSFMEQLLSWGMFISMMLIFFGLYAIFFHYFPEIAIIILFWAFFGGLGAASLSCLGKS